MTDERFPILKQWTGELDYVKIAEIRNENYGGRSGRLVEPFASRMGWFDYDRLLRKGRAEGQGFTIYTLNFGIRTGRQRLKNTRNYTVEKLIGFDLPTILMKPRIVSGWGYQNSGICENRTSSKHLRRPLSAFILMWAGRTMNLSY